MIRMASKNDQYQQHIIEANEPVTVSIMVIDGKVHTIVYRGINVEDDAEPVGAFDGSTTLNLTWQED